MNWGMARGYGYWVFPPLLAAFLSGLFGRWLFFIPLLALASFMAYFHRDPERFPAGDGMISPADGRVVEVLSDMVTIFMGPFDVHVNRSPINGLVSKLEYIPGGHMPAFTSSRTNEKNMIEILGQDGPIKLFQISGVMVRKIVCYVRPGDTLTRGQRVGMIRFGSRVKVTIPPGYIISIKPGDRVRAGETIIAVRC